MAKTNSGLIAYCAAQVGKPYWFGTFGQTASAALYEAKKAQYAKCYTAKDFPSQYGQRVHDCAGLIKGYLWSDTPTSAPKYNAKQDFGATAFYQNCTKKGAIGSFDRVNGRLVFKGANQKMSHVGVYCDGYVYEAKGHAYGVVKSQFNADWTHWGQCNLIEDDTTVSAPAPSPAPAQKSVDELAKEVLEGKWGNGDERKKRLTEAGFDYKTVQARVNEMLKGSAPSSSDDTYTVVKGDTLSKIGAKLHKDWKEIARKNGIKSPYIIRIGQKLKV